VTSCCKQGSDVKKPSRQRVAGAAEQHQLSKWEFWSHTGLPKLINGNWGAPHHTR